MFLRKTMMDPDKGGGGGGGNPPGVHDLNPGGGGQPPPAADVAALQKRIAEMEQKEGQYIEAINRMAERIPGDDAPPPPQDEEPLDPAVAKRVDALLTPLQRKIAAQEDMIDQQMFMNLAAAAGVTPEQVGDAEKQYQQWKRTGLKTVAFDPETRQNVERTPNRQEALDFVLGRAARQGMLKEAPARSLQTMRQQLLGGAAFDTNAGGSPRRSQQSYEELEAKPIEERIKAREAALDREGF